MAQLGSTRTRLLEGAGGFVVPEIVVEVQALVEPHLGFGRGGDFEMDVADAGEFFGSGEFVGRESRRGCPWRGTWVFERAAAGRQSEGEERGGEDGADSRNGTTGGVSGHKCLRAWEFWCGESIARRFAARRFERERVHPRRFLEECASGSF